MKSEIADREVTRELIQQSSLFDPDFYRSMYHDVVGDPLDHWLSMGWLDGRRPSSEFDPSAYLAANPDVAAHNVNPLVHWLRYGMAEGRSRAPLGEKLKEGSLGFDGEPRRSGGPALIDAEFERARAGQIKACTKFDPHSYLIANPDVADAKLDPLFHWTEYGEAEGRLRWIGSLHPFEAKAHADVLRHSGEFDAYFYRETYSDVLEGGYEALDHYVVVGWRQRRRPSACFDPSAYLEANPDLRSMEIDLFRHWIEHGKKEGRLQRPLSSDLSPEDIRRIVLSSGLFDPTYYAANQPEILFQKIDPLEHYLSEGWRHHLRPSAEFNTTDYIRRYPEAMLSNVELISFHEKVGRKKGFQLQSCGISRAELTYEMDQIRESGLFNEKFYKDKYDIVTLSGLDPLYHYITAGYKGYFNPSKSFDVSSFIAANPELASTDLNPLTYLLRAKARMAPGENPLTQGYQATASIPSDRVDREIALGINFFARHGFHFHTANYSYAQLRRAVAELASRQPILDVDDKHPAVSIIIPVYGQTHFVLGCLDSLASHESRYSAEIIVIDDSSPIEMGTELLHEIGWIHYIRRDKNGGFINACNDGASRAKGEVIIFLNSDTRLVHSWLDELVYSFETFPKAGLIGSKLLNEDGSLQEAGGVIWRDGSAWNYGRNHNPDDPRFCFARKVDYCSGASIAVIREAWQRSNGFDDAFSPAYCEDADLAIRLKKLGFEVWYQAQSAVIHYEGKTHGRDTSSGVKSYQIENLKRLAIIHKPAFSDHRPAGEWPDDEAIRGRTRRVIVVDAEIPSPDRDAGSDLCVAIIDTLVIMGYDITFVPSNFTYRPGYTEALQRKGVEVIYSPLCLTLNDVLGYRDYQIEFCFVFRYYVFREIQELIRARLPLAPVIFHNVDLHYLRERRAAEIAGNSRLSLMAQGTMEAELAATALADSVIVTNEQERAEILLELPNARIEVLPYFAEPKTTKVGFEARRDLLFLGGFRHHPNIDAVHFFVARIWPKLTELLPDDVRFNIVGPDAPPALEGLVSERVRLIGYAEDLGPWFERSRVFVAPLRYGAGVKGKVIQSLRHGVPAVVTSIAAEGVGLRNEEHVLVENEPEEFAGKVAELYSDKGMWERLQLGGYEYLESTTSRAAAITSIQRAVTAAGEVLSDRMARRRKRILRSIQRV